MGFSGNGNAQSKPARAAWSQRQPWPLWARAVPDLAEQARGCFLSQSTWCMLGVRPHRMAQQGEGTGCAAREIKIPGLRPL